MFFITEFLALILQWKEDWKFLSGLAIIQKSNLFSFIDSNIPDFSQKTKQLKHSTEDLLQQLIWQLLHFFPEKKISHQKSTQQTNKNRKTTKKTNQSSDNSGTKIKTNIKPTKLNNKKGQKSYTQTNKTPTTMQVSSSFQLKWNYKLWKQCFMECEWHMRSFHYGGEQHLSGGTETIF